MYCYHNCSRGSSGNLFLHVCGVCLHVCGPILSPEYGTYIDGKGNFNQVTSREELHLKRYTSNLVMHFHKLVRDTLDIKLAKFKQLCRYMPCFSPLIFSPMLFESSFKYIGFYIFHNVTQ